MRAVPVNPYFAALTRFFFPPHARTGARTWTACASLAYLTMALVLNTDTLAQNNINQNSKGNCSPNISAGGNVTVVCPRDQGGSVQAPCDPASEGALSNWNARILQNQRNWAALVDFGEAKLHLLNTYCDKDSKITKTRFATTYGLLGASYFYVGNKQMACRSWARASRYFAEVGNEDDYSDIAQTMKKVGC